jgi:hypothetical protein
MIISCFWLWIILGIRSSSINTKSPDILYLYICRPMNSGMNKLCLTIIESNSFHNLYVCWENSCWLFGNLHMCSKTICVLTIQGRIYVTVLSLLTSKTANLMERNFVDWKECVGHKTRVSFFSTAFAGNMFCSIKYFTSYSWDTSRNAYRSTSKLVVIFVQF